MIFQASFFLNINRLVEASEKIWSKQVRRKFKLYSILKNDLSNFLLLICLQGRITGPGTIPKKYIGKDSPSTEYDIPRTKTTTTAIDWHSQERNVIALALHHFLL